jgi:tryptophanyl-tRNA synthetase
MSDAHPQIVLSGIRATGTLHIGNYLGAIRYFADLAKDPDKLCLFFIANLHSLTTRQDPEAMEREMRDIVRWYLAAGIDPERHIIFAQSSVPETTELAWLLSCMTTTSELERMPHWDEKKEQLAAGGQPPNAGLFTYPVLMAADILGPGAHLVPVGADQHPHVELCRTLARRFNQRVGEEVFPVPELIEQSIRVPGLKGSGKMGKSAPRSTINLDTDAKAVRKRCMKADKMLPANPMSNPNPVEPRIGEDAGNPEICRVFQLHCLMAATAEEEIEISHGCRKATLRCGDCKGILADRITQMLAPLQERYMEVAKLGDDYIDQLLRDGGARARAMIAPRVNRAKTLMGVRRYG